MYDPPSGKHDSYPDLQQRLGHADPATLNIYHDYGDTTPETSMFQTLSPSVSLLSSPFAHPFPGKHDSYTESLQQELGHGDPATQNMYRDYGNTIPETSMVETLSPSVSSSSSPLAHPQVLTNPQTGPQHSYRKRDEAMVRSWLELCNNGIGSMCQCRWANCGERFVSNSSNAHIHVHKHMGTQPFECVSW